MNYSGASQFDTDVQADWAKDWSREDEMARHVDLADTETARKKQEAHEAEAEKHRIKD